VTGLEAPVLFKICFIYIKNAFVVLIRIYEFNIFTGNEKRYIRGIAFDPKTKVIYWTDSSAKAIFSSKLTEGSNTSIVHQFKTEEPMAIAVDHCNRYF